MLLPFSNFCVIPLEFSRSMVRWYPLRGIAAMNTIESGPEQRVQIVPPGEVVAVSPTRGEGANVVDGD
jgi:hypothetical protein